MVVLEVALLMYQPIHHPWNFRYHSFGVCEAAQHHVGLFDKNRMDGKMEFDDVTVVLVFRGS